MQRSLGVTILACIFVFIGGIISMMVIIEIIDSLNQHGFESILVSSVESFKGFFVYALLPLIIYNAGIGMLLLRPWARRIVVFFIPVCVVLGAIIEKSFSPWTIVLFSLIYYFNLPQIKGQFVEI